jgi:hypothetical protein
MEEPSTSQASIQRLPRAAVQLAGPQRGGGGEGTIGPNRIISLFNCNHLFHQQCISNWFRVKGTCPLCRTPVAYELNAYACFLGCVSVPQIEHSRGGGGKKTVTHEDLVEAHRQIIAAQRSREAVTSYHLPETVASVNPSGVRNRLLNFLRMRDITARYEIPATYDAGHFPLSQPLLETQVAQNIHRRSSMALIQPRQGTDRSRQSFCHVTAFKDPLIPVQHVTLSANGNRIILCLARDRDSSLGSSNPSHTRAGLQWLLPVEPIEVPIKELSGSYVNLEEICIALRRSSALDVLYFVLRFPTAAEVCPWPGIALSHKFSIRHNFSSLLSPQAH